MNKYQRLILITAAIVLIAALWTTPKYITYGRGTRFKADEDNKSFSRHTDVGAATVRATSVIGASLFLYFAAGNVRRKKEVIT